MWVVEGGGGGGRRRRGGRREGRRKGRREGGRTRMLKVGCYQLKIRQTLKDSHFMSHVEVFFPSSPLPLPPGYDDENGSYIKVLHDHIAYRYEIREVIGKGSFGQVVKVGRVTVM